MEPRIESELLRTLVTIADTGSFTRAAERLGRTQSAISMQVKKLEAIAGRPLFARGRRGARLTGAGELLSTSARRILRLLDEAARALDPDRLEGAVRVGIAEEYGSTVLPDVLAGFAGAHPGLEVTVSCGPSLALDQALAQAELDLAVLWCDLGDADGEVLVHDPTVWVTSIAHLAHQRDPLPLAMFDRDCWWRDRALRSLDDAGRRYRIAFTSAAVAGIQAAIGSGLAVGVLGRTTLPAGCRTLTRAEGFANLPGSNVLLKRRSGAASETVDGMASAIRRAFRA